MPYPHVYITLTPEERPRIKTELQRLARLNKWHKRKPLQALYLSDQKKTFQNIADYLGISYRTVKRSVYRYKKSGLDSFLSSSNKG